MNQFGDLYSKYYDLFYQDKDYQVEVNYVTSLIQKSSFEAQTILDLGCGTGKHAELFCEKGFIVHGIDLSSDMLLIAEKRRVGKESQLSFNHANIQDLKLNKKFDVVTSLFHVMSYQNSNEDLTQAFKIAKKHLVDDGILIFDFWYGSAVLTDLPTTRIKRLENDQIQVTRLAEPVLYVQKNIVDVHYHIFIKNKETRDFVEKRELHSMRYLFDTELELICNKTGFEILNKYEWMSQNTPNLNSWNVVWVVKRNY